MPNNQGLYPKETIADLFNLSERRIEQLAKQKIIPKAGRGVFDLGPTVKAYVSYLQSLCAGSHRTSDNVELNQRMLEARVLERESKARQAKCKADLMEQNSINSFPEKLSEQLIDCEFTPEQIEIVNREAKSLLEKMLVEA